jgi:hypothetical protein
MRNAQGAIVRNPSSSYQVCQRKTFDWLMLYLTKMRMIHCSMLLKFSGRIEYQAMASGPDANG